MKPINFDEIIKKLGGSKSEDLSNDWCIPHHFFRAIFVGSSGCGKTNLLLTLILEKMKFDKIVLVAKDLNEDKYELLRSIMVKVAESKNVPISAVYEQYSSLSTLIGVDERPSDNKINIIIFDDLISEKHQEKIEDYFTRGRKKRFTVFYLSHRFTDTPKMIRNNATFYVIFSQRPKEVEMIYQGLVTDLDKSEFKKLFSDATRRQYDFLTIDQSSDLKYRKNLDEVYVIRK